MSEHAKKLMDELRQLLIARFMDKQSPSIWQAIAYLYAIIEDMDTNSQRTYNADKDNNV